MRLTTFKWGSCTRNGTAANGCAIFGERRCHLKSEGNAQRTNAQYYAIHQMHESSGTWNRTQTRMQDIPLRWSVGSRPSPVPSSEISQNRNSKLRWTTCSRANSSSFREISAAQPTTSLLSRFASTLPPSGQAYSFQEQRARSTISWQ